MKQMILAAVVALIPLAGVCQERVWQASPFQPAPGNQRLNVHAHEFGTRVADVIGADVHIVIFKEMDRTPVPTSSIQKLRILDTDGRPIEFTDQNPDELQFESVMLGRSTYAATYELVDPSRIRRLGEIRFEYQGRDFVFDMRASEPIPDNDSELAEVQAGGSHVDSELAEVQVGGSHVRPKSAFDGILCVPETYVETRLTPEQQAAESADPELRRGRETVERHLIASMTRNHSVVSLKYGRSEDRGDEIWFVYNRDFGCTRIVWSSHNQETYSWNRKTDTIQGRNP